MAFFNIRTHPGTAYGNKKTKEQNIKKQMNKHCYTVPWHESDSTIRIELLDEELAEIFHVHSSILSISSPVFDKMLNSNLKEDNITKEIILPEKDPKVVLEMLNIIYPMAYSLSEKSECEKLLELAEEYDIKRVFTTVDEFLAGDAMLCQPKFLLLAEKFQLEKTKVKHMNHCFTVDDLWPNSGDIEIWAEISAETKLEILLKKARSMFVDGQPDCAEPDCDSFSCGNDQHESRKLIKKAYKATQQAARQLSSRVTKAENVTISREHVTSDDDSDYYNDFYDGCDYSGYST